MDPTPTPNTSTLETMSREELLQVCATLEEPGLAGYFDFVNVIWFVVGALLLVGSLGLVAFYVAPFVKRLPRVAHEALAWAGCALAVILPWHLLAGGGAVVVAAVGCLCMPLALLLTLDIHASRRSDSRLLRLMSGFLFFPWTAIAIAYASPVLAVFPVLAFLMFTGDTLLPVMELAPFAGQRDVAPPAMLSAAMLLAVFAGVTLVVPINTPDLAALVEVFRPAATWLGGLTWFAGCLALSSKRYRQAPERFWLAQLLSIVTVTAAIFVGSVYELGGLQEAGGTFLVIYLLEKFFEIPWRKEGYVWMCLSLAGLLYFGASIAEQYPQYFLGL